MTTHSSHAEYKPMTGTPTPDDMPGADSFEEICLDLMATFGGAQAEALVSRIERLAERVSIVEDALEPFARHPEFHATDDFAVTFVDEEQHLPGVTAGDFRRARKALVFGERAYPPSAVATLETICVEKPKTR